MRRSTRTSSSRILRCCACVCASIVPRCVFVWSQFTFFFFLFCLVRSTAMKSKSSEMKKQFVGYLTNPGATSTDEKVKHVSPRDKIGRMYRGMASVFTIDDEPDGRFTRPTHSLTLIRNSNLSRFSVVNIFSPPRADDMSGYPAESEDYSAPEIISIKTWLKKADVVGHFQCHEVKPNDQMFEAWVFTRDPLFRLAKYRFLYWPFGLRLNLPPTVKRCDSCRRISVTFCLKLAPQCQYVKFGLFRQIKHVRTISR